MRKIIRMTGSNFLLVTMAAGLSVLAGDCFGQSATTQQKKQVAQPVTTAVQIETVVLLGPSNTRISFIGTHMGKEPKPRLGGFGEFNGVIKVNANDNSVKSIVVDMDVNSVWTEFAALTKHLKTAEFFDVAKFGRSKFVSTDIKMEPEGKCTVVGDLTLHGETKQISFPAACRFENGGFLFAAKFQLDRSQFGMDQMLGGVEKAVSLEIFVGQKTTIPAAQEGHGGDSKKKQSSSESETTRQHVSINLPKML